MPLLRRSGLTIRTIEDENAALSVRSQIKFLNSIAEALEDGLLGFHLVVTIDKRRIGLLHYVAASSDLLGEALRRVARYSVTINEGVKLRVELGKTLRIGLEYAGVSRLSDRHQIEAWITLLVRECRTLTGRKLQPVRVRMVHQRIPESVKLDRFLNCTVEYGADADEVLFSGEAAMLPIASADRYLNKILSRYCDEAVARRKASSGALRERVENAIAILLPHGQARIGAVAQRLGIGPRTLRRRLAAEGDTFGRILTELRMTLGKRYLAERDLPISRIAWLLGYTEISSFSHAFRRWTGSPPRTGRARRRRPEPRAHASLRT